MSKKITAPSQDFSGQDPYEQAQSEGVADAPELDQSKGGWGLNARFLPTIDDPSQKKAASVIIQSDDPRLHLSRMSGTEPPNPVGYRGPDRRPI